MAELEPFEDDDFEDTEPSKGEITLLHEDLKKRCKAADIPFEEQEAFEEEDVGARIGLQAGREKRWVYCFRHEDYQELLAIQFERYAFLNGLEAVCAYDKGHIEAMVRPLTGMTSPRMMYARLFGISPQEFGDASSKLSIDLASLSDPATTVSLSPATRELRALAGRYSSSNFSLKIQRDGVTQHDQAEGILRMLSDALFFQIDLLTDVPLALARDRRAIRPRPRKRQRDTNLELKYPATAYDSAPISLYWYARSAVGMPLLQFLAYYQVIEFYYPTYSQAEARRRLRTILKDPTFRGDRDADIGKVLSVIQVTRTGAVGDERSQLKATLSECIDPDALKEFLTADPKRSEFLSSKAKGLTEHKLSLATPNVDLRNDVADRIYEIRCKIVHTKTDPRTGDLELLLPFSKEADQLLFDIELVQYLAQQVLVSASAAI
jgi:hypothetical protein